MIIAVDFDGTLHTGDFPKIGNVAAEAEKYMNKLKADGHYLIIWTCRHGDRLTEAINWLIERGIPFDRINEHEPENIKKYQSNSRKVYAHLYVDDKQVGGLPSWKGIYEYATAQEEDYKRKTAIE